MHTQIIALNEQRLPSQYNLPCGIIAGVMSTLITQPADVIKTRMQIHPQKYPTLPVTIASVLKDRGLGGLFIGTLPRTTRRTLMAAFTWAFYEEVCTLCNLQCFPLTVGYPLGSPLTQKCKYSIEL